MGERVWIWNAQWQRPHGTAAEYVVLPAAQAAHLPDNTSFEAGACMGIPALTALQAMRLAGDVKGKQVLVTGASSSVGHYLTQMLSQAGASVIGTVGNEAKAAHAKAAGASHTLFYKKGQTVNEVKALTQGQGVDAVIDMDFSTTAGWLAQGILKHHGQLVCYGANPPPDISLAFRAMLFGSFNLKFFLVYDLLTADRLACLTSLNAMLTADSLQHTVLPAFSLAQVVLAHETVEAGQSIGNVILQLAS
jgi:NADPH2:quinone reductase